MYGVIASNPSAMPGINTPATTIGLNILRSSCSPRKYHGAFDGFGVELTSASPSSGAFTSAEKMVMNAISDRIEANSSTSRCGQTWTLSWASARGLLDRARLDDGEQALGVTARTGARGRRRRDRGRGARAPPPPPAAAGAASPPPPASAALRLRDRSSRCAGTPPLSSVIASPASDGRRPRLPRPARLRRRRRRRARRTRSRSSPSSPSTGRPSALRRSRLRLSRCSGTSAMLFASLRA